ncbi:MAG: preprotein translocase subunit YajC [Elusimicrobia bacterium]|nr:preprotein translocase subunit YajC [Elusimicrobiota bacterium]
MNQNALMQFVPLIIIMFIFYFLLIRPQQKQMKERNAMLANLKTGDKVLTNGGIIGLIIGIREDELEVEIAKSVKVTMVRSSVAGLANQKK